MEVILEKLREKRKLIEWLVTIFVVVALLLSIGVSLQNKLTFLATSRGTSMQPVLANNDLILFVPYQVTGHLHQAEVGDIIVFRAPAVPPVWCHRVVGMEDGKYVTQGDNNRFPDSFVTPESDILGVVPCIGGQPLRLPYLGSLLTYLNTHFALRMGLLAACVLALFIMGGEERKKRRVKRTSRLKVPAILLGVSLAVFGLMFIPSISKSGYTAVGYQVAEGPGISSGRYAPIDFGIMQIGTSQSKELFFQNKGIMPSLGVLHILDNDFNEVSISPLTLVLGSRSQQKIDVAVDATEVHPAKLVTVSVAMVPYLMPADFTRHLAGKNPWLPSLVVAAVPALLLPAVLYPLLPRMRRRRADNKRKKPGFPTPIVALIAPLILVTAMVGTQYFCYVQISTPALASIEISEQGSIFGEACEVEIGREHPEQKELFTITNNLGQNIHLEVELTQNDGDILTPGWGPKQRELPPEHPTGTWHGTLDARELGPGEYILVFHVYAYTEDSSFQSDFDVTVSVKVITT